MTKIRLEAVAKTYDGTVALHETSLHVADGEFVTLLGPSGSGKTTILNMIAGMATPSSGRVHIDGRDVTDLPPSKRELGMVFQHYALMPHMTVFENIAFPLRVRKWRQKDIDRRVHEILEIVRLPEIARRRPRELSGGQQQRVAIARCLAYRPSIILMDEPLGALDKKLREELQLELKRVHFEMGITIVYVTHDQEEALTMSDRIVLMNKGHIEQAGTPKDLYLRPNSHFAATFLGNSNILEGWLVERDALSARVETAHGSYTATIRDEALKIGQGVTLLIRPENVSLRIGAIQDGPANVVAGHMVDAVSYGGTTRSFVEIAGGKVLTTQELIRADREMPAPGTPVNLVWDARDSLVLPVAVGTTPLPRPTAAAPAA